MKKFSLIVFFLSFSLSILAQDVIVASWTLSAIKSRRSGEYELVIHSTEKTDRPDVRFNAGETVNELFYNITVLDSIIRTTSGTIKINGCEYSGKVVKDSLIRFNVDSVKGEYLLTREDIIKLIEQLVFNSYVTFDQRDKRGSIKIDTLSSHFGWFIVSLPKYRIVNARVFAFWEYNVVDRYPGEVLTDQDMKKILEKSFLFEDRSSIFLKKAIECLISDNEEFR